MLRPKTPSTLLGLGAWVVFSISEKKFYCGQFKYKQWVHAAGALEAGMIASSLGTEGYDNQRCGGDCENENDHGEDRDFQRLW